MELWLNAKDADITWSKVLVAGYHTIRSDTFTLAAVQGNQGSCLAQTGFTAFGKGL